MNNSEAHHPFTVWSAYLNKRKLVKIRKSDIIINDYATRRFTLGVETAKDQGLPVFGLNIYDAVAFQSIQWASAGFVLGHDNKDWIAFAAKDIRPVDSIEPSPVPLRLWIPFPIGIFDTWMETQPSRINIKRVRNGKRGRPIFEKTPFISLPLTLKDKWPTQ